MKPLPHAAILVVALLLPVFGCGDGSHDADRDNDSTADSRQADVAARGSEVMPFDLEQTTHHFEEQPFGGIQRVVADDAADSTQIALIRDHLRDEAERFSRGDFGDPAQIHGQDMPGLPVLSAGADRLDVSYSDIPAGGEIRYETEDSVLVQAVHTWFAAQRSDHGRHAHQH